MKLSETKPHCDYCKRKYEKSLSLNYIIRYRVKGLIVCCACYNYHLVNGRLERVNKKYNTDEERLIAKREYQKVADKKQRKKIKKYRQKILNMDPEELLKRVGYYKNRR